MCTKGSGVRGVSLLYRSFVVFDSVLFSGDCGVRDWIVVVCWQVLAKSPPSELI